MADDPTMSEVDDPQDQVQTAPAVMAPLSYPVQASSGTAIIGNRSIPFPVQTRMPLSDVNAYQSRTDPGTVASATLAAERQAQEDNLLQQSLRTEDALKAVAAARRFIATRKLGNDYQKAVQAGLPHEQAWAQAAVQNLEAFGGNMAPVTAAMKLATPKVTPENQPLPNVATPIYDPNGNLLGYRAQTSANAGHIQWVPRTSETEGKLTDVEKHRIKSLEDEKKELSKNLVAPSLLAHPVTYMGGNKEYKSSTNRIAQIQKEITDILDSSGKKTPSKGPKTYVYKDGKLVEKQ